MSMTNRVSKAVDDAFRACGDLVKQVTLATKDVTGFNNATQTVVSSSTTVTASAIPIKRQIADDGQIELHLLFKAKELPLNKYVTVTLGTEVFRIESFDSNNFSVEVIAKREK